MSILEVRGAQPELERAALLLHRVPGGIQTAVSRALSRALTSGRARAVKEVRSAYTLAARPLRESIRLKKPNRSSLEGEMSSRGALLPLSSFRVRPGRDTTGANRAQPRVQVKREGGLKPLGQFVYRGQVFRRLGARSKPLERFSGPAAPQLLGARAVAQTVQEAMAETFEKRLAHETERLLEK